MCGIAAVLFHDGKSEKWADASLRRMLDRIGHRGYRFLNQISAKGHGILGCVRLPIRDPLAGIQPAFNGDRSVTAILNGEIYNAANLLKPAPVVGDSDAAFLPYLYRRHLSEPPQVSRLLRCRGMFAIALHECPSETTGGERVLCLRDHMGIKPLFIGEGSRGFFIASESKALLDQELLWIREVLPGRLLTFAFTYGRWTLAEEVDVTTRLREVSTALDSLDGKVVREMMARVIERQWPTEDMPVAVLCSGGIDSSIVTYELSRRASATQPLVAYTASCASSDAAEVGTDVVAARNLCRELGVPLREVSVSHDDIFNELLNVIYHTETFEPNVVRNAAIQFYVMRAMASDGFRVAFCGEGADELFWGYADFASSIDPDSLAQGLLQDLHRTQLLRVDRVGMAHTVEVRVPFLDEEFMSLALSVQGHQKRLVTCGIWLGKGILREAYANVLPDEIVLRRKATFAFGSGFGGVEMDDPNINDRALNILKQRNETVEGIEKRYPAAFSGHRRTPELALYVSIFSNLGFHVASSYAPPIVAMRERN